VASKNGQQRTVNDHWGREGEHIHRLEHEKDEDEEETQEFGAMTVTETTYPDYEVIVH
jgi:hypothetical protein